MKASIVRVTVLLVAMLSAGVAAQRQWGFDADSGSGGVNKSDVTRALGVKTLSVEDAEALVFTVVDSVDGCVRERRLRTVVRTSGNDSKVTGFWFFGYVTQGSCGSGAAGADATIHVNGIPIG
jgi:hypothetical protein